MCVCMYRTRLAPSSSSSMYVAGMPINKRLQPCGPPSPAGMPHRSTYLQGPPGRDQPVVSARYGLQMASVPSSYDAAAAVAAAAAFHAQSYPPVSIPHGILIDTDCYHCIVVCVFINACLLASNHIS